MNERVTVYEAAKRLGISEGALRQRIHRGKLDSERDESGRVYVYLTGDDTVKTPQSLNGDLDILDELRDRIKFLESELDDRKEESKRKDTIIAQMNQTLAQLAQRVPELEVASDARESAVSDSETEAKGAVPQDAAESKIRRSWWQRLFGVSVSE